MMTGPRISPTATTQNSKASAIAGSVETDLYPDAYDEMVTGDGAVRPHWRAVLSAISALPRGALAERSERARQQFAENGVTYNIHADPRASDRPYRFDVMPLIIDADEWAQLEAGLSQRARLVEAILADAYGPQRFVRDGLYPSYLLHANPEFLRPCRYALAEGRRHLGLYVVDLIRTPDGHWRVLADRTQAPAGIGFALENRRVLARTFPEGLRSASVRPLQPFFDLWQAVLSEQGASANTNPRGVVLSSGPLGDNYFEQIYLARQLGLILTEGADLTSRGGRVFLKTLGGLQQVDVILRRIESGEADPLELDGRLGHGVPGLLDAVREGQVNVVNAIGTGLMETSAFAAYFDQISEAVFGERLSLPAIERQWLGAPGAWGSVEPDFDRHVIRQTKNPRATPEIVGRMTPAQKTEWRARIEADPRDYTAQVLVSPSVTPTWTPSGLQPRPLILRTFILSHENGYTVMPGGLGRVPTDGNPFHASLQRGGIAKDVWILSAQRASFSVPGPAAKLDLEIKRTAGELPSRAADNLYWLGRYTERLDVSVRILRSALLRLVGGGLGVRDMLELGVLAHVASVNGLIEPQAAAAQPDSRVLAAALTDYAVIGALAGLFEKTAATASPVRDRFSADMWVVLGHLLDETRQRLARAAGDPDRLLDALSHVLRSLSALAGMGSENMTRGTGWRFFDLGRRVERAVQTLMAVTEIAYHPHVAVDSAMSLILEICDSTITYRTRYLSAVQPGLVLDLVLADDTNPRSVGFQLVRMLRHLRQVPGTVDTGGTAEPSADLFLTERVLELIETIDYPSLRSLADLASLKETLEAAAKELQAASDALSRRHFSHVTTGHAYVLEAGE
jgi:uncharacterized circularly permuted ATP-grasp superfamily protein/uncharacterized alpha-E superfamily protein